LPAAGREFGPDQRTAREAGHEVKIGHFPFIGNGKAIRTIFPHPTLSETMHEAVLDAFGRAIHF
jgi:pyruvate/2-oxoglutarate dehydrogenase complex dihydrolipoamide dehydrogenase (E3) component